MESRSSEPDEEVPVPPVPRERAPDPPPRPAGRALANVSQRIQEIFDAAERVANEIQAEAEAEASRLVRERRREAEQAFAERLRELKVVTGALAARATSVQREVAELTAEVDDVARRLTRLGSAGDPSPVDDLEPVAYPGRAAMAPKVPEEAVLRATQMAVAGTEREAIEEMLGREFGVSEPGAVLDDLLSTDR